MKILHTLLKILKLSNFNNLTQSLSIAKLPNLQVSFNFCFLRVWYLSPEFVFECVLYQIKLEKCDILSSYIIITNVTFYAYFAIAERKACN